MIEIPDKFTYKTTITNKLRNEISEKLRSIKDPIYLEVGSDKCLTCFALNKDYKKCYAVDIDESRHKVSYDIQEKIENITKEKIENIERVHGTIDAIDSLEYDVVLIDGDHSYEGVKKDFETLIQKNTSKLYYVFFHDYGLVLGGVKKYVDEIIEKDKFEYFYAGEEKDWNPIGTSPTNDWESVCLIVGKVENDKN